MTSAIHVIHDPETLDIIAILLVSIPNGQLYDLYGDKIAGGGKVKGESFRYRYKEAPRLESFGAARVSIAVIGDESGKINLALWNEQIDSVTVNDTIEVENGYVSKFRGTKQLNIGRRGTLKVIR